MGSGMARRRKHTRTLATRLALDRELEHITRDTDINVNFDFLDMKLQENIERNDKKKGERRTTTALVPCWKRGLPSEEDNRGQ